MFPLFILTILLCLFVTAVQSRVSTAARASRHLDRPLKLPWLPIVVAGMPLAQSGNKAVPIGSITLDSFGSPKEIGIPAPPPGYMYNNLHIYADGTVTAAAGGAVGNGSLDIINTVDVECAQGDWHVRGVRFIALWYHQYARDSYTPTAVTTAGAGGGACAFNLHLPVTIKADDGQVKLRLTTNAAAIFHSTATAISVACIIRVDAVRTDLVKNTRRIIYRENVLDAIAIAGTVDDHAEIPVEPSVVHAYMVIFSQSAAGTLANLLTSMHYIIGGEMVIQVGTTWEQLQEEMAWDYDRAAVVAGIAVVGWDPRPITTADNFHILNGAAACTRSTGLLQVYFGS